MASILKKWKKSRQPYCSAVVVAAGNASRMQGVDKIMTEVAGVPVIARTLSALEKCEMIDEVVVVTRSDLIFPVSDVCANFGFSKVKKVVEGGSDRARSVLNGLKEINPQAGIAAIHDGARPFVTQRLLKEAIQAAINSGAAAPAIPVSDTIKQAKEGIVTGTPDRSTLFAVQTPQVFDADFIRGALHKCIEQNLPLTDDCSAAEQMGKQVVLTQGDTRNIKITTQFDLVVGEAIIRCQSAE